MRKPSIVSLVALLVVIAAAPSGAVPPRTVFVTSVAGPGNLENWNLPAGVPPIPAIFHGLAAGDYICGALALRAGLPGAGSYRAWLSDVDDDAFCRALGLSGEKDHDCGQTPLDPDAGPWARVDGLLFADSLLAMASGSPSVVLSPARLDENGNPVGLPHEVWTGTSTSGRASDDTCFDWESASAIVEGTAGSAVRTVDRWTFDRPTDACELPRRLLCIQTGAGPAPPSPVRAGRFAFLTSVAGTGDLGSWPDGGGAVGVAAGDAICRARAAAGGLAHPESFKAWLSDIDTDARDRFASGPWKRVDGFLLASSLASLTDGVLGTAIDHDELGRPVASGLTWTGTSSSGERIPATCDDWRSGAHSAVGEMGLAVDTADGWTALGPSLCEDLLRLYCLSDATPALLFADGFESGVTRRLWSATQGSFN